MKKYTLFAFLLAFGLAFTACEEKTNSSGEGEGEGEVKDEVVKEEAPKEEMSWEKDGLKVYALEGSPAYEDASLTLNTPPVNADLDAGKNMFSFGVENYVLGEQTSDAATKGMANSGKGQHIHFILNNGPYSAQYEPEFLKEMEDGHYVLLAFLARSYHESVKNGKAAVVQQFVVGQPENYQEADLNAPHMFYSRPKGTYKAGDYDKLLLDFYLVNLDLSPEGYKVRATINGVEFTFTKWMPYVIEGLEAGELTVKLELLDAEGKLVESPFNPVERTVTLAAAEES